MTRPISLLLLVPVLMAAKTEGPMWPGDLERTPSLTTTMTFAVSAGNADPVVEDLPRSLIQDSAEITSWSPERACFRVSMQTAAGVEESSGDWIYTVNDQQVWPEDATLAVYDYPFTGERTVVDIAGVTPLGNYASFELTEPEDRIFRVIHRTATVCGPGLLEHKKKESVVRLDVSLAGTPGMMEEKRRSTFIWTPQAAHDDYPEDHVNYYFDASEQAGEIGLRIVGMRTWRDKAKFHLVLDNGTDGTLIVPKIGAMVQFGDDLVGEELTTKLRRVGPGEEISMGFTVEDPLRRMLMDSHRVLPPPSRIARVAPDAETLAPLALNDETKASGDGLSCEVRDEPSRSKRSIALELRCRFTGKRDQVAWIDPSGISLRLPDGATRANTIEAEAGLLFTGDDRDVELLFTKGDGFPEGFDPKTDPVELVFGPAASLMMVEDLVVEPILVELDAPRTADENR